MRLGGTPLPKRTVWCCYSFGVLGAVAVLGKPRTSALRRLLLLLSPVLVFSTRSVLRSTGTRPWQLERCVLWLRAPPRLIGLLTEQFIGPLAVRGRSRHLARELHSSVRDAEPLRHLGRLQAGAKKSFSSDSEAALMSACWPRPRIERVAAVRVAIRSFVAASWYASCQTPLCGRVGTEVCCGLQRSAISHN